MKQHYLRFYFLIALLSVFVVVSCNAPHENPVDPNNPQNKLSIISGVIKTEGYPFTPIENVDVFWKNDNKYIRTNRDGKYRIPNIIKKDGWLKFNCDGYKKDSLFIKWDDKQITSDEVFLNSIPKLDSLEFFSVVENRFQFTQKHYLQIKARVSDSEGVNDIKDVIVRNEDLNLSKTLVYNPTENYYVSELLLKDLKVKSLNEIIGKDFEILVRDLDSNIFVVGVTNIKRIINEEVELISPINNETVSNSFKLSWRRFIPGYKFAYRIEIYTNETSPNLVFSKDKISYDGISFTVDSLAEKGNLFWVIWAIDEFNNQSRSKPGSFIIGN